MKSKMILLMGLMGLLPFAQANSEQLQANFLKRVNQSFVEHTLKGVWGGECIIQQNGQSSFQTQYTFLDKNHIEIVSNSFGDTACYQKNSESFLSGEISLDGVKVNRYGESIYHLLLKNQQGTQHIYLSLANNAALQIHNEQNQAKVFSLNKKSN